MFTHWQCTLIAQRLDAYRRHRSLRGKARSWEQVGHDLVEYDYTLNPDNPRESNATALGESLRRFNDLDGRRSIPNDVRMAIVRDFLISEGFLDAAELSEEEADGHLFSRLNAVLGFTPEHVPLFEVSLAGNYVCLAQPDEDHYERHTLTILFNAGERVAKVMHQRELFRNPRLQPFDKWSKREYRTFLLGRKNFAGWAIMSPQWGAALALFETYGKSNENYNVLFASVPEPSRNFPMDLIVRPQKTFWNFPYDDDIDANALANKFMLEGAIDGARVYRRTG